MQEYMIWVWLGVFVVAFIVEAITQDLVSVWFGLGAIVCVCISGFTPWWVQLIVFVIVSAIALAATRPLVKKILSREERKTNTDDFIGRKVKTITEVSKFDGGVVKINGIEYGAMLMEDSDTTIEKDVIVEVVAIKGNKLIIKELEGDK